MLPHQKNKIDISSLSEEDQKLFRLYGKLPSKKDILSNKLKERKYFDSGDYALSKAGKASDVGVTQIGSKHPSPENIPHSTNIPHSPHSPSISAASGVGGIASSTSPVGDSYLQKSPLSDPAATNDSDAGADDATAAPGEEGGVPQGSPPREKVIPSRWVSQT